MILNQTKRFKRNNFSLRKFCSNPTATNNNNNIENNGYYKNPDQLEILIENLPNYAIYDQLKSLRTKIGDVLDMSEVDELVCVIHMMFFVSPFNELGRN
jgi:hypothetical protein